jgi:sugar phosphate isomerase/epimerase
MNDLRRLSLNQITIDQWSLAEVVEACAGAGVPSIGVWRHKLDGDAAAAAHVVRDAGLRVSSLCRGGFFAAATEAERRERDDDNRRAVEEAAELGTDVLVLVCGPASGRDLAAGRAQVAEGIERLLPHAIDHGVRLGIEPLHPMFVSERSVVCSLGEASDLAERFDAAQVGVVIDVYHVFWEAGVERQIEHVRGRILGFHVCDWVTPTNVLAGRAMMGDGVIDLRRLRAAVERAGYDGPIEVEVISEELRQRPGEEVLSLAIDRYRAEV